MFATQAPHIGHQGAVGHIYTRVLLWSDDINLGQPILTPGLIFSDADNVIPDVVWVSHQRLAAIVDDEGHLTGAPELVMELLSAGGTNERRDIEIYRRDEAQLQLYQTLLAENQISSPVLPGFSYHSKPFLLGR